MNNYITTVEKTDAQYHRSAVILHRDWQFHFADFSSIKQLNQFAKTLGFTYTLVEERPFSNAQEKNAFRKYEMSHEIRDATMGFWKLDELPKDAKPIKALSNGSIVDCYFTNDGKIITFYRPNPNATQENKDRYKTQEEYENALSNRVYYPNSLEFEAVYHPLTIEEHRSHCAKYGTY